MNMTPEEVKELFRSRPNGKKELKTIEEIDTLAIKILKIEKEKVDITMEYDAKAELRKEDIEELQGYIDYLEEDISKSQNRISKLETKYRLRQKPKKINLDKVLMVSIIVSIALVLFNGFR